MAAQISESTRRKVSRVISHHRAMGARLFIALWGRVADAVRVLIPVVLPDAGVSIVCALPAAARHFLGGKGNCAVTVARSTW